MSVSIVLLEDDEDLRFIMDRLFKHRYKIESLCLSSYFEFVAKEIEVLAAKIVLLDINLGAGKPSGIDAYDWLQEHSYGGKVFFLTGHACNHPLVSQATKIGVRVLEKPIGDVEFSEIIKACLAADSSKGLQHDA